MMEITKLIEFLDAYPIWVRGLLSAWVILSAVLFLSLVLVGRTETAARGSTATGSRANSGLLPANVAGTIPVNSITETAARGSTVTGSRANSGLLPANVAGTIPVNSIVDSQSGLSLSSTLAKAFDRGATDLQREQLVDRLNGWDVVIGGVVYNASRFSSLSSDFCVAIKIDGCGAPLDLVTAMVPKEGERWVRSLIPGQKVVIQGALSIDGSFVSLRAARPV